MLARKSSKTSTARKAKPKNKPTKPVVRPTHVAIVIDKSSSIQYAGIQHDMVNSVNAMIGSLKNKAQKLGIVTFADNVQTQPMKDMQFVVNYVDHHCYGNTALFDGCGAAIQLLGDDKNVNYLVILFTDGEENCSTNYNKNSIKELITKKEGQGNWTVTFQVPKGKAQRFQDQFGISAGNVTEWEQNSADVQRTTQVVTQSINNYFGAISRGQTQVKDFYVNVDLKDVKSSDVKQQLTDFQNQYLKLNVNKDDTIKPFIERNLKKPYIKGNCYYELIKSELVQKNKSVLITERGKQSIYGGNYARNLIGLPPQGQGNSKVTPVNLSKYHVFVQSTSVNRKLAKGSSVLVKT